MKIRSLIVDDVDILAGMLEKLASKMGDTNLLDCISPAGGKTDKESSSEYAVIGVKLFTMLIKFLTSDVRTWFASLVNVTPEAYKKLPFNTDVDIMEQLVGSKEANDFFTGALRLYKRMQGLKEESLNKKKGSGIISGFRKAFLKT